MTSPAASPVVRVEREGDIPIITIDNPPVNALSAEVRDGLYAALAGAIDDPQVGAIVYLCAGPTFVAGGDIGALGTRPGGAPTMEINRLQEDSPKPIIAALHGSALGGGLEITLAAHWRIAADDARLGLPEVKLGILPGAGGTQRLPRLVGLAAALEMIVGGDPITAERALALGLVDRLCEPARLREAAIAMAREAVATAKPLRRARDLAVTSDANLLDRYLDGNSAARRGAKAPAACIEAVRAALTLPFDDGLRIEREILYDLIPGLQSRAMRHVFFAQREAWKLPDAGRDLPSPTIRRVVVTSDSRDGLAAGRAFAGAGLAVIFGTDDAEALANADLVFDPGFGAPADRRAILAKVAPALHGDAICATMAAGTLDDLFDPARTLGIHFFYPADDRVFVEVIRPAAGSPAATLAVLRMLKRMGKQAVVATSLEGIAGAMMTARQHAAELLVAQGRADPQAIDAALCRYGFEEGVFAWLDRIGLDTAWLATGGAGDALRARLCAAGRTGAAAGKGFYDYDASGKRVAAAPTPPTSQILSDEDLLDALLLPIANVALKLVEQGAVVRESDADLVAVTAHGWPTWRGGPLFHLNHASDAARAVALLQRLAQDDPDFYAPARTLIERAAGAGADLPITERVT